MPQRFVFWGKLLLWSHLQALPGALGDPRLCGRSAWRWWVPVSLGLGVLSGHTMGHGPAERLPQHP